MLSLVATPILMVIRSMQRSDARVAAQHSLREPIEKMVRDLNAGYNLEIYAPGPPNSSNSIYMYDSAIRDNLRVQYYLDSAAGTVLVFPLTVPPFQQYVTVFPLMRDVQRFSAGSFFRVGGSPFVVARGVTYLFFQPRYQPEASPGIWANYTLPVPNPTAVVAVPPVSSEPPRQYDLILVRVIGYASPDAPKLDLATSFFLRN